MSAVSVFILFLPATPSLSIKSHAAPSTPNAKPAYAVLCIQNKTFHLRQVQTSNCLFITQPALEAHGNEIPTPVTRAIASCTATLELHLSDASAVALLREVLPVYDIVAGDVDATGNGQSKVAVFDDIPLSNGECQSGWEEIFAFELENSAYQPSAHALTQVWRSINAAALAEGIKLDSQFLMDDVTKAVAEDGHPPGLVEAMLRRLANGGQENDGPWCCLDRTKTVAFTAQTLLEAKEGNDFLIIDLIENWEDMLPDAWRKAAQLSAIEGAYVLPTETTIRGNNKGITTTTGNAPAAAAKPSARKWHEKFGKTRKQ
jgi:sister chromatid cohesion protein DCC1